MQKEQYLTVTALTKYLKSKLETDKNLINILLKGEISNFKKHSRGHFYFTIKDEGSQISAIMFVKDTYMLNFDPKDGDNVLVTGRISLYEPSGSYSIQVNKLELDGIGELYLQYEKLKKELAEKGYFDTNRKKVIPKFPKKIGVITSKTGAVIEDIKNTISRRYLLAEINLFPCLVQGSEAAKEIKKQIELANRLNEVDVLIVGRGGGSMEDLWSFNEILVIDAIYNSKIPIITAIGHETDYTISDFVGDLRAPTPTAAAELATPNIIDIKQNIENLINHSNVYIYNKLHDVKFMLTNMDRRLDNMNPLNKIEELMDRQKKLRKELDSNFSNYLYIRKMKCELLKNRIKSPIEKIEKSRDRNKYFVEQLLKNYNRVIKDKRSEFVILKNSLQNLDPLKLMDRGFSVVRSNNKIISSIDDVSVNDELEIRLKDGIIISNINDKRRL